MGIIADIRQEAEYKKFKKILARTQERLNVDKDQTEALSMHAGRTSRRLYGAKQYSPKALIDASLNDLAVRSRLVEVRVQCSIQIDLLHDAIKTIKHYITTQYHTELAKFKTVGQRNALIDRVINEALTVEGGGQALIKLLDDLINDIDKSSFQLRNMLEALKLLDGSKSGQVV
jgi:hypothetical protein